jgi:uncharacterized membrane protein
MKVQGKTPMLLFESNKIRALITSLFIIFAFASPVKAAVSDVDFEITDYKIDAYIQRDGSMKVVEAITYDGSFNGQFWNLEYATGGEKPISGSLEDVEGNSALYNAHDIKNIRVSKLIGSGSQINSGDLEQFSRIDSGSGVPGDDGVYELSKSNDRAELKIFSPTYGDVKTLVIEYELSNVAVLHNDVAEVYWNFIGEGWEETLNNIEIDIYLPLDSEELRIFAHGPLTGTSELVGSDQAKLKIEKVYPGEELDARLVFSTDILTSAVKVTNNDALGEILRVEEARADEANAQRDRARAIKRAMEAFGIGWLLLMISGTIFIYFKYDKEFKPVFYGKYYRELPGDYGPAVMSYNYYFKKISPRDLTATILNMIRNKVFTLSYEKVEKKRLLFGTKSEDVYTIIDNSENLRRELTREESHLKNWLIKKIGNGKSVTFDDIEEYSKDRKNALEFYDDYDIWKTMIEGKAQEYGFFDKKAITGAVLGVLIGVSGIIFGVIGAVFGVYLTLVNIPVGIFIIIFSVRIKRRSKNGNEDYVKWKAFREFLTDFSKIDDAVVPSVIIWEHYLVYAVSLGVADKVIDTMKVVLKDSDFKDPNLTYLRGGYGYTGFYAFSSLNTSLDAVTRNAVQSAMTQHSSGTGGGGGFSIGGGGGGGGGTGGGGF